MSYNKNNVIKKNSYYELNINKIILLQRLMKRFLIRNKIINYKNTINKLIKKELKSKNNQYIHDNTLLGDNSIENIKNLEIAHKIRQKQMKEGKIAQIMIGNFIGWQDLKSKHVTGLDCKKLDNSIIIELKNKYNTCNSGSQKSILDKLAEYKIKNPQTRCIWGIINPKKGCDKLKNKIIHNGVEIEKIQGKELLKLVFTIDNINYSPEIIKYVKKIMYD